MSARESVCGIGRSRIGTLPFHLIGGVDGARFGVGGGYALALMAVFDAGADEGGEERVRGQGLGFEFGMELAAYEPRVVGGFDDFDVHAVGCASGDAEAGAG